MRYDFLQVTDELLDVRAPALSRLLSVAGRRVSRGDAVVLVCDLERYVVRRVNAEVPDLLAEFQACALLPDERVHAIVSTATGWPLGKTDALLEALADPEVRVIERHETPRFRGWLVRGVAERYGRLASQRRASRERTRNNDRARDAGWVPGEGKAWVHEGTGAVLPSLAAVIARLDKPQEVS